MQVGEREHDMFESRLTSHMITVFLDFIVIQLNHPLIPTCVLT